MPTVKRASLDEVLDAVRAELAVRLGVPAARVRPLARHQRDAPHLDGDQDILLRIRGFRADADGHRDRHDCRVVRRLSVVVRTRVGGELDEAGGDELLLGHDTGGVIFLEEDVIDALQGFFPRGAAGDALTYEALYVLEGGDMEGERQHQGWGQSEVVFAVPTELPLTQR